jgi:membrane protein implicated in regulation of membrane protease activity
MRRLPWFWILFSVVLLLLLVAALMGPPIVLRWDLGRRAEMLSIAETASAINQIRSATVQGIGTVVVLAGAYVAWRQLQHNMRATQAQIELQRASTLTDRYTRVVDQLASTDETIRVGAIHALDRIAAEAATERAGAVALLATYVRV